jgi:hypothetical protein
VIDWWFITGGAMAKPPDAALAHDKATEARGVLSDKMRVVTGCRTFGNQ